MLKHWWKDKFGDLFTIVKVPCDYCGGAGILYDDVGPASGFIDCEECGGSGEAEVDVYEEANPIHYSDKVTL